MAIAVAVATFGIHSGVASLAVDAACRWAFATLPVDRIELCHAVENAASGRVAQKAGFTYEGIGRSA